MTRAIGALAGGLLLLATPSAAQDAAGGQTAQTIVGQVGQRQTREATAAKLGRAPLDRIDTRQRTRVQSRIRNRIDRGYVAGATGTSAFDAATAEQAAPPRGQ